MARNPFLSGLMGGMLGAGLIGMMFGGGFAGGLAGGAGMLGLLLQVLLIGGVAYLAVRLFRGWSAARAQAAGGPAYAYAGSPKMTDAPMAMARTAASLPGGGASSAPLDITADDYGSFESLLTGIQAAYSNGDLASLRGLATPEMLGYFSEELSSNASRGVENKVEAVKLEQGDLSEAWSEGSLDYATVAMRFSMIDVTRNIGDGRIVEGNDGERVEATEVWTFLRSRGGKWILSAIQQA
jgi:predicted lipid-binding transport protein (Tim44 family)